MAILQVPLANTTAFANVLANGILDSAQNVVGGNITAAGNIKSSAGYVVETAADNLTAFAGGGQGSAKLLSAQTNRLTVVATGGDSVKLPASLAGLELTVINHGANACQVYGTGTDTIDDVAAATGVSQMAGSVVLYFCSTAGQWYTEGLATGYAGPLQTLNYANALTATGANQGTALALAAMINRITTAAAGTGVLLPAAASGLAVTVINRGANPVQVYGAGTDTINGVATATGVSQMANSVTVYTCSLAGAWETDGVGQGFAGNFPASSYTNAITAFATGGQASAVPLTTVLNRVTIVGTAADSVKLPQAIAGMSGITVYNSAAANSLNVFPFLGDSINALAANTAFAVPAGKNVVFGCAVNGTWHAILSA